MSRSVLSDIQRKTAASVRVILTHTTMLAASLWYVSSRSASMVLLKADFLQHDRVRDQDEVRRDAIKARRHLVVLEGNRVVEGAGPIRRRAGCHRGDAGCCVQRKCAGQIGRAHV